MSHDLQLRNQRPRLREPGASYFVTWCLAQGAAPLTPEQRTAMADCLRFFDGARYHLAAWVVMDDHVHVVVTPLQSHSLDSLLHSWRSYSAHRFVPLGRPAPVWRRDEHDRIVRLDGELAEKVRYVAENPWRRWPQAGQYPWVFPQPGD